MIVFDLDDTLYPERQFVESGFRAVEESLRSLGHTGLPFAETFLEVFHAEGSGKVFNKGLARLGVEADISSLIEIYREHNPSIRPFEGIPRLIESCDGPGLITDGGEKIQRQKLEVLGLLESFSVIICTSSLAPDRANWKPSTKPFELMEREAGLSGANLTYVGDDPLKDFDGALKRGWKCLRLRMRHQIHEAIETPLPVREVRSTEDLAAILLPHTR